MCVRVCVCVCVYAVCCAYVQKRVCSATIENCAAPFHLFIYYTYKIHIMINLWFQFMGGSVLFGVWCQSRRKFIYTSILIQLML